MRPALLALLPLLFTLTVSAPGVQAQQTSAPSCTAPAWRLSLTPEQRELFDGARKDFDAKDFSGALPKLRHLHEQVPQNGIVTKFTAEAAVNTGDNELASSLLDTILREDPDDPQALGIQAHVYGQQHDVIKRDLLLAHLQELHDAGKPAPASAIIERDPLPEGGTVRISDYFEPQGRFHIVLMAEYYDASGQRIERTALESDDIDQVGFQKKHPDQAASGVRVYSMDSYSETRNAQGQITAGTHSTLCPVPNCLMTGRPSYELFRSTILARHKVGINGAKAEPAKPSK